MTEQLPAEIPERLLESRFFVGPEPNLVHRNGLLQEPDENYEFTSDGHFDFLGEPMVGDKWTLTWSRLGLTIWIEVLEPGRLYSRLIAGPTG